MYLCKYRYLERYGTVLVWVLCCVFGWVCVLMGTEVFQLQWENGIWAYLGHGEVGRVSDGDNPAGPNIFRLGARVKWRLRDHASLLFPPPLLGAASPRPPLGPTDGTPLTQYTFVRRIQKRDGSRPWTRAQGCLGRSFPNPRYLELGGVGERGDCSGKTWAFGSGTPQSMRRVSARGGTEQALQSWGSGKGPGCPVP